VFNKTLLVVMVVCVLVGAGLFVLVGFTDRHVGSVVRVVDGDTFVLDSGERVRIVGVDAPEVSSGECFAVEAKDALSRLVLGKSVVLVDDVDPTDKYGRHLAYVMVDGIDVGLSLAADGFVRYMFVAPNYNRAESIKLSVYSAVDAKKGMWGDDGC
jgi:micrococcal nuclease